MRRNAALWILCLLAALLLSGCSFTPPWAEVPEPAPTPEPTPAPTVYTYTWLPTSRTLRIRSEELDDLVAQRELLPELEKILLLETVEDPAVLDRLHEAFPDAVLSYRVELDGRLVDSKETELDLSRLSHENVPEVCERLALLPNVTRVILSEDADWEDVGAFQALPSAPTVDRPFTLYGRHFNTTDEFMDLNRVKIGDKGAALREVLPYMTNCRQVDMEDCGIRNEEMAVLRDDFPSVKIVWRVHFNVYSVRTDETRILASIKEINLNADTVACLKYCTEVRYLDLGHNIINNISFVSYMPDLEVAILAINYWTDASPLASCSKLEYLEMFNTNCRDLSPLAELKNLKHLNICWLMNLSDITPLYGLTQLERLWIGSSEYNSIPRAQLREIREKLPDTEINTSTENPTEEGWRFDEDKNPVPRYALLIEQMRYNDPKPYSMA